MTQALLDHVTSATLKKRVPTLKSGYTVRVHQKIKEGNKERVQVFEGLVIRMSAGTGVNRNFTVRKVVDGVGVEKLFPLYSPNIEKIEVLRASKVRRSKLYYMRNLTGKSTRLRDEEMGEVAMTGEEPTPEPEVSPEPEAAAEPETVSESEPEPTPEVEPEVTAEPTTEIEPETQAEEKKES